MLTMEEARARLAGIPDVAVSTGVPLSGYTRFGIGGPADILVEAGSAEGCAAALEIARGSGLPTVVMGGGTNLVVSDRGFRGIVLRFVGRRLAGSGQSVVAEAGAILQDLVDFAVSSGLRGLETLAGIPGSVGGAVYGNAGAYGHSISERVVAVGFHDGRQRRTAGLRDCGFEYRGSAFKRNKLWVVLSVELRCDAGDAASLRQTADEIVKTRNEKFSPTMKCAGSIFKNVMLKDLPAGAAAGIPAAAVRDGKVAAAWFLERAGAREMARGDIRVAPHHANILYNAGAGTSADLCALMGDLQARVRDLFAIELEEEVQYVG